MNSSRQVIPGPRQSLCLSCNLAYGHLCFAVPFEDRDWVLAYEERAYAGSHEPYVIRLVSRCTRYERMSEGRCRRSERKSEVGGRKLEQGEHGDWPQAPVLTRVRG